MSPGRWAEPEGIFSTNATTATAFTGAFRAARARIAPKTAAETALSAFISSMFADG